MGEDKEHAPNSHLSNILTLTYESQPDGKPENEDSPPQVLAALQLERICKAEAALLATTDVSNFCFKPGGTGECSVVSLCRYMKPEVTREFVLPKGVVLAAGKATATVMAWLEIMATENSDLFFFSPNITLPQAIPKIAPMKKFTAWSSFGKCTGFDLKKNATHFTHLVMNGCNIPTGKGAMVSDPVTHGKNMVATGDPAMKLMFTKAFLDGATDKLQATRSQIMFGIPYNGVSSPRHVPPAGLCLGPTMLTPCLPLSRHVLSADHGS